LPAEEASVMEIICKYRKVVRMRRSSAGDADEPEEAATEPAK